MEKIILFFFAFFYITPLSWAINSSKFPDHVPIKQFTPGTENTLKNNLKTSSLTVLYVDLVVSSTEPKGEKIKRGQFQTNKHHGGKETLVTTVEIGFGSYPIVITNGQKLPESSMINISSLCKKRDGTIGDCSRGETIVGHRRIWDISGYGNGEFSLQITSNEYPHNTMMTKLYIR